MYLLKGVPLDFGTIFWVVIIGALSVIFVFEWIGLFKNKRIKVVNIVCSSIALGATLLGSIIGALTFYNLYSQYFGLLGETLTSENSFTSFSVLFYVELVLMIVLLVLSILSDKGTIFLKQRRSVHADDRKIKP